MPNVWSRQVCVKRLYFDADTFKQAIIRLIEWKIPRIFMKALYILHTKI